MPRSIKRPITGHIVWYYAAPPSGVVVPSAAIVVNVVNRTTFGLTVFDSAAGTTSYVASVPFYDGATRPASGAWCTNVRAVMPAQGAWPKDGAAEGPLGTGGVVVT